MKHLHFQSEFNCNIWDYYYDTIDENKMGDNDTTTRRKVFFVKAKPDYFVITDVLTDGQKPGKSQHTYIQRWTTSPSEVATKESGAVAIPNLVMANPDLGEVSYKARGIAQGRDPKADKWLYHEFTRSSEPPALIETVLYPYDSADLEKAPRGAAKRLDVLADGQKIAKERASAMEINLGKITDYYFSIHDAALKKGVKSFGPIKFDGEACCLRKDDSGKVVGLFVRSGRTLESDGAKLVELDGPGDVSVYRGAVEIYGEAKRFRIYCRGAKSVSIDGKEMPFKQDGDHVAPKG